jgi:hypothetical protein
MCNVDKCDKILMIMDKDMLDFQYKEAIKSVCECCKVKHD